VTENKQGLVDDGEKDEKKNPQGPRGFLAAEGITISDGVLGGERRNLAFNSGAEGPKFDSRQKTFKGEERALHPSTHTQRPAQQKPSSINLLP